MKTIIRIGNLMVLTTIFLASPLKSQRTDSLYEAGTWRGFCQAAVTYTFDDGLPNQFRIAVPMFNAYGFKGTFFIVTDWTSDWKTLQKTAAQGHEIASHTMSHPYLDRLTKARQVSELKNSADIFHDHINGLHGMTIAYPYCVEGDDSITALYYLAARACQGNIESNSPDNFYKLSSIVCGDMGPINSIDSFNKYADRAASIRGWCVYLIHAIDGESGYSPLTSEVLKGSLDYLSVNTDKFWVATFGDVVRYIRERNCLTIDEHAAGDSAIYLDLRDTLPDNIYNCPVTLRRILPLNWQSATGIQNGKIIPVAIFEKEHRNYIQFDALPDGGEVLLLKNYSNMTGK
jgi:peptidoglycan/xylan/chitin deacetylase (PgdA/CDA1 family)